MDSKSCEVVDPRIRRTRLLLQQGLDQLLKNRSFDQISVQDITEAATVNRATFYDHYTDKFALLECVVGTRFHELLEERGVRFDGGCGGVMRALVLAVCDYLSLMQGPDARRLEPHLELAVIAVVRRMLLDGLKSHPSERSTAPEMIAATASWAIYGAAKEWAQTADRPPADLIADQVVALVSPVMQVG